MTANYKEGLPWWLSGEKKYPACQCRKHGFDSWVRKIAWRRKWQPSLVFFLPGKSHGQRSLAGYSLWGPNTVRLDLATEHSRMQSQRMVSQNDFSAFLSRRRRMNLGSWNSSWGSQLDNLRASLSKARNASSCFSPLSSPRERSDERPQ